MKIIGLTGGIASGKNFVADIFKKKGAAIFDADDVVHKLLSLDKSVIAKVAKKFPDSFVNKRIDRKILGKIVFADAKKLQELEKIIHPQVRKKYREFLNTSKKNKKLAVLNIPLLLETKGYKCDKVITVVAAKKLRLERYLAREMKKNPSAKTAQLKKKFSVIIKNQMSDAQRKAKSDFVLKNHGSAPDLSAQVEKILMKLNS